MTHRWSTSISRGGGLTDDTIQIKRDTFSEHFFELNQKKVPKLAPSVAARCTRDPELVMLRLRLQDDGALYNARAQKVLECRCVYGETVNAFDAMTHAIMRG